MFPVPDVEDNFDENGYVKGKLSIEKRAANFVSELMWCIEAGRLMAARKTSN
jgi:hypothetical protein